MKFEKDRDKMKIMIIIGQAGYPDDLNKRIETKTDGLEIIDVKTISHCSKWHHKTDYVIVTILYKKK